MKNKGTDTEVIREIVTRKCYDCGGVMEGTRSNYKYTECGLDSVSLVGIFVWQCKCGAIVPEIPAMSELHRAIVFSLLKKDTLLSGSEIRFLRKMAGLSGVELAQLLGVHKTSLSKWENGSREITKKTDATLRLLCFTAVLQELAKQDLHLPNIAEAVKKLSAVDIHAILRKVEDRLTGPKKVTINPDQLAQFGAMEEPTITESVN
ncbi:MAG TPA: type II TA system antitoxin MqsA family protein [Candidatus Angelobacter sp.]